MTKQILLFSALLLPMAPVGAETIFEEPAVLDALVASTTGSAIGQPGGAMAPIDSRLKLPKCPGSIHAEPGEPGSLALRCPEQGWRIRVPLIAGRSVVNDKAPSNAEILIKRGDSVLVTAVGQGFSISHEGTAMDQGSEGSTIRVKLSNSPSPVSVIVTNRGHAIILTQS